MNVKKKEKPEMRVNMSYRRKNKCIQLMYFGKAKQSKAIMEGRV